ncbi:MAG: hypothetical protein PVI86_13575 [Phycisphaerae bacterium]|jgi:hypothetical protein
MKSKLACLFLGLGLVVSASVRAEDQINRTLATIPGDAMGFVLVPSLKTLDADYQQAVMDMGLQPMVQPPFNSLVGALKTFMPMLGGLDESGPLAVVFMPAASLPEISMSQALLVSTKDPKAMIEAMGGQAGEGGLWSVTLMGQPAHAAAGKDRVILAQQARIVTAVKESKSNIATRLKPETRKAFANLDVAIWIDADRLFKLIKPLVDGFMTTAMAMQQASGGLEAKSAEINKKNMDAFFEGTSTLLMGVALDKGGLGLRGAMEAKAGSELIKQLSVRTTTESLLGGLPASDYLFAFGETIDPGQMESATEQLDVLLTPPADAEGVDTETMKKLKGLLKEAVLLLTGLRGTVEALPPGPDGLFGLSLIIDTSDSRKAIELKTELIEHAKALAVGMAEKAGEDEVVELAGALMLNAEAEEIGGVKVMHAGFDLEKIKSIDDEDREDIFKVIGKEGLLFRMAPVNAKRIVASFGGGKGRMAALMESAKKDAAPLEVDAGITKVAGALPAERASVAYLAADRILASVNQVLTTLEEDALPVTVAPIHAPLAMATRGGDGWVEFDMFFPTELLVAGKNAAMTMMGQQQTAQPSQPPSSGSQNP